MILNVTAATAMSGTCFKYNLHAHKHRQVANFIRKLRLSDWARAMKGYDDIDHIVHYVYKVWVSVLELQSKHSITN